jgi:hypothetical protein
VLLLLLPLLLLHIASTLSARGLPLVLLLLLTVIAASCC